MKEYVVETIALSKSYKHRKAVSNISMHVQQGDIYGLLGRNGAGKSTTLKMIAGLIHPSEGTIHLFGQERDDYSAKRIGALIETPGLYPGLSAYDNMEIKAVAMGLNDK